MRRCSREQAATSEGDGNAGAQEKSAMNFAFIEADAAPETYYLMLSFDSGEEYEMYIYIYICIRMCKVYILLI